MNDSDDDKPLIDFCAFILSNEGSNINAEQYWRMFGDALGREIKFTLTHEFTQAILSEDEGERLAKAMEIAEKMVKSADVQQAPTPNT
jgi:hypothetical protein